MTMLGLEPADSSRDAAPVQTATTPVSSSDVTSGLGFAFSIQNATIPTSQPPMTTDGPLYPMTWSNGGLPHFQPMVLPSFPPGTLPTFNPGALPNLHPGALPTLQPGGYPTINLPQLGLPMGANVDRIDNPPARANVSPDCPPKGPPNRSVSPPPSRERLSYTRYQIELLNDIYTEIRYPNSMQKQLIAKRVGITREQVKIWFQNRRRKDVTGKVTMKDEVPQSQMVPEDVKASVLNELTGYTNDPKGQRAKASMNRQLEKKKARMKQSKSSPGSTSNSPGSNSRSPESSSPPVINTDAIEKMFAVADAYRPNNVNFNPVIQNEDSQFKFNMFPNGPAGENSSEDKSIASLNYLGQSNESLHMPLTIVYPNDELPKQPTTFASGIGTLHPVSPDAVGSSSSTYSGGSPSSELTQNANSVASLSSSPDDLQASNRRSSNSAEGLQFNTFNFYPPVSTLDSQTVQNTSASPASSLEEQRRSPEMKPSIVESDTCSCSEDSNDSTSSKFQYSTHIDIKAPPNKTVLPNSQPSNPVSRKKRARSESESDCEEPPPKKHERLAETVDSIVPPNKVAPPSSPIKLHLLRNYKPIVPATVPLSVVIPNANNYTSQADGVGKTPSTSTSGSLLMTPVTLPNPVNWSQQWVSRAGDPRMFTPGMPRPADPEFNGFSKDGLFMTPPGMPPGVTEIQPSLPFRDFYSFPHQPGTAPWDLSSLGIPPTDSRIPADKSQYPPNSFVPETSKVQPYGGFPDGNPPFPHIGMGRQDIPPWSMGHFPNPYCSFGPGPLAGMPDARSLPQY